MPSPTRRAAVALTALTCLAACTSVSKPRPVVTVTVPPSASSSAASSSSPSAAATSPTATTQTALPGTCDDRLADYTVGNAVGRYRFGGTDSFVVGTALPDIGRVANINCRYGVTGSGSAQKRLLEIGVSLYRTVAQASARVDATVADYTAHGASAADVTVAGAAGHLLTGGAGADYADPTLVVAVGQRTIAVTVGAGLATGDTAASDARTLAQLAADRTAG